MRKLSGVEITNIVFIVLATILGLTAYMGAKDLSETKRMLKDTQELSNKAKSTNSTLTKDIADLKTRLGYEAVTDAKELVETMRADIKKVVGVSKANETYCGALVALQENLAKKQGEINEYQTQSDAASDVQAQEDAKTENQQNEFDDKIKDFDKQHQDLIAKASTSLKSLQNSLQEQTTELQKVKQETDAQVADA